MILQQLTFQSQGRKPLILDEGPDFETNQKKHRKTCNGVAAGHERHNRNIFSTCRLVKYNCYIKQLSALLSAPKLFKVDLKDQRVKLIVHEHTEDKTQEI